MFLVWSQFGHQLCIRKVKFYPSGIYEIDEKICVSHSFGKGLLEKYVILPIPRRERGKEKEKEEKGKERRGKRGRECYSNELKFYKN